MISITRLLLGKDQEAFNSKGFSSPAKGVVSVMAARVQIPASPLKALQINICRVFLLSKVIQGHAYKLNAVTRMVTRCGYSVPGEK